MEISERPFPVDFAPIGFQVQAGHNHEEGYEPPLFLFFLPEIFWLNPIL